MTVWDFLMFPVDENILFTASRSYDRGVYERKKKHRGVEMISGSSINPRAINFLEKLLSG